MKISIYTTIVAAALSLSACTAPSITGGTISGTADVALHETKPAVEFGVQFQIDLGKDAVIEAATPETQPMSVAKKGRICAKPLLDLIGSTEGTDKGDGYNETLAYGAYTNGDVNLTVMTLAEIDMLQTKMLAHPENSWNSSAIGRYQIVRTTLRKLTRDLQLVDTLKFTPQLQDRLAIELLNGRGYENWKTGRISDRQFALGLSKEWASLPNPETGKGYYSGQHAAVSYTKIKEVLGQICR